ncbi:MAG: DUF2782 domain-containing protein [Magnetococcales bacterium]|nr:DUF2782 domain-containing protein [Magnetococcales bacterium]
MLFNKPSFHAGTLLTGLLFLLAASPALAQESHAVPAKGPLVSELKEKAEPEGPETVIRKYEDAQGNQVRESAVNGAVFQIQVTPYNGPPYYLIDNDGDGLFETRINGYEPKLMVPQWVLLRF